MSRATFAKLLMWLSPIIWLSPYGPGLVAHFSSSGYFLLAFELVLGPVALAIFFSTRAWDAFRTKSYPQAILGFGSLILVLAYYGYGLDSLWQSPVQGQYMLEHYALSVSTVAAALALLAGFLWLGWLSRAPKVTSNLTG